MQSEKAKGIGEMASMTELASIVRHGETVKECMAANVLYAKCQKSFLASMDPY